MSPATPDRSAVSDGAPVPVALRAPAGDRLCLHDHRLDDETTGSGPVAETPPDGWR